MNRSSLASALSKMSPDRIAELLRLLADELESPSVSKRELDVDLFIDERDSGKPNYECRNDLSYDRCISRCDDKRCVYRCKMMHCRH